MKKQYRLFNIDVHKAEIKAVLFLTLETALG